MTRAAFTLPGTGRAGYQGGPGKEARFSEPSSHSFGNGRLYIADTNNHLVRVTDLQAGDVWTLEISGV